MAPDDNLEQFQDDEARARVAGHYARAAGFGCAADMREACLRLLPPAPRRAAPEPPPAALEACWPDHPLIGSAVVRADTGDTVGRVRGVAFFADGQPEVQMEPYA